MNHVYEETPYHVEKLMRAAERMTTLERRQLPLPIPPKAVSTYPPIRSHAAQRTPFVAPPKFKVSDLPSAATVLHEWSMFFDAIDQLLPGTALLIDIGDSSEHSVRENIRRYSKRLRRLCSVRVVEGKLWTMRSRDPIAHRAEIKHPPQFEAGSIDFGSRGPLRRRA